MSGPDDKRDLAMAAFGGPAVIAFAERGILIGAEPHGHARGQLIGCGEGVLGVDTELGTWLVPARHAVWLPPHHVHSGRTHGVADGWSLYLDGAASERMPPRPCTLAIPPLAWEAVRRAATWDGGALDASQATIAALSRAQALRGVRQQGPARRDPHAASMFAPHADARPTAKPRRA